MNEKEMISFMRLHPKWYLILSRYPEEYPQLLKAYKIENRMTLADRIERVGMMLSMLELLM